MVDPSSLSEAVRKFRPACPNCSPAVVLDEESRPCSFYDCPGLPEELVVTCDQCMYDFVHDDGQPKCDHSTCETALKLKSHVPIYLAWLELLAQETETRS